MPFAGRNKEFDHTVLLSSDYKKLQKRDFEKIVLLFKEYKSLRKSLSNSGEFSEKEHSSIEEIYRYINKKAYLTITSNSSELGDIVIQACYEKLGVQIRAFALNCFSEEIFNIIKERKNQKFVRVPLPDKKGNVNYLFDKYSVHLINIE